MQGSREIEACCCSNGHQGPKLDSKVSHIPCFHECSYLIMLFQIFILSLHVVSYFHLHFYSSLIMIFLYVFCSVIQGSVSEYCFHNCKTAPIIIVPGKGILLMVLTPQNLFFFLFSLT